MNYEKALLFAQLLKGLVLVFDGHQKTKYHTGRLVESALELDGLCDLKFRWTDVECGTLVLIRGDKSFTLKFPAQDESPKATVCPKCGKENCRPPFPNWTAIPDPDHDRLVEDWHRQHR